MKRLLKPPGATLQARLNIAAIFIAVGLGALTVVLLYDPGVLIPRAPYYPWIFAPCSLAALAMILVLGLEDDIAELDDTEGSSDHPMLWRAIALAYLAGAVASATFIGGVVVVNYLERATA